MLKIEKVSDVTRDRLNFFIMGPPGSGKTHFALTAPNPCLVDFEDGSLTAVGMGLGDTPIIRPGHLDAAPQDSLLEILKYPEEIVKSHYDSTGYMIETFVFDTVSSMQDVLLGQSYIAETKTKPGQAARGILGISRNRVTEGEPSLEDFKSLHNQVRGFFNLMRRMPYHTIATCHVELNETPDSPKGPNVPFSQKKFAGYPSLTGKLRYNAAGLADFVLLFQREGTDKPVFSCYTKKFRNFEAPRTRMNLKYKIDNPKFQYFLDSMESVKGETK